VRRDFTGGQAQNGNDTFIVSPTGQCATITDFSATGAFAGDPVGDVFTGFLGEAADGATFSFLGFPTQHGKSIFFRTRRSRLKIIILP